MRILAAVSLFWVWERSFWLWDAMPGGDVSQANGRVRLVDVLPARAGGPEGVHPDLVPVELDFDVALHLGQDLHEGEGRVAALLRVERADPDEPVHAALGLEVGVGVAAVDGDGDALDAGLLALGLVQDLRAEPVAFGPAQVHSKEHRRPVGRLRTARPGADRQKGVALVVLAAEEQLAAGDGVLGLQRRRTRSRCRRGRTSPLPPGQGRAVRVSIERRPGGAATAPAPSRSPSASRSSFWAARWSSQNPGSPTCASSSARRSSFAGRSKTPRGRLDPHDQVADLGRLH